ncbi:MAG: hypothetical protein A3H39_16435 [candidate division NC10 bacterium RIFCSPLOWO2_02_FULL_66_22]|nr:MAG: hypothetical protein A3H39_16435 [candidate division NC10 bacterium RIFCSPLOWO2_02_FULL_66_22]
MRTILLISVLLLTFAASSYAGTPLEEYEKAKKEGYFDKYKEAVEKGGGRTKEEFDKIDKAQPGDTHRDTNKRRYIKRCGYANINCTWEPID